MVLVLPDPQPAGLAEPPPGLVLLVAHEVAGYLRHIGPGLPGLTYRLECACLYVILYLTVILDHHLHLRPASS